MAKELKTGWKRIGRSGATVDGRKIDPAQLKQAALSYNKETFTALIWPEHERWYNMGTVEELRTEKNAEGGVDLFAIIAPNEYYQSINRSGQKLFTSMELLPDFRKTGEVYLTGLAATDNPASAGTSEMRFSSINNKDALLSVFTEHAPQLFNEDQAPGWFQRFAEKFTQPEPADEDTMDKKDKEAFEARFTALEQGLAALKPEEKPSEDFAALKAEFDQLTQQFAALKSEKAEDKSADALAKLTEDFAALQTEFKKAVGEQNGTNAGEHFSSDDSTQTDC
ncbi:GPO family capsid scaffolding protein [Methylobacter sp. G7]|uniref:GPO family capsid scaffolding protein n=1 Tax=Methylobacter sp. G7 TaxID=3230117 RepID=UPI003D809A14